MERAKEAMKRQSDAENLKKVAEQNVIHLEHMKQEADNEKRYMRALEAEWSGMLDKQERARDRLLKATYSRQAIQGAAADNMQTAMKKIADADEARAIRHAEELERAAAKREQRRRWLERDTPVLLQETH